VVAAASIPLSQQQHLYFDGASWEFYERLLNELADRSMRVTFSDGSIEIMPPLPEHEWVKEVIGSLIDVVTLERNIPIARFGSTTLRRSDRQKGLEPDKCYYLKNAARVRGMREFDSAIHPPPDLAIEVDITRRSIEREPIYAALGVPELWRYDGQRLKVLILSQSGTYQESITSAAFPFLPMQQFEHYIQAMGREDQTAVLRQFKEWVASLGPTLP
jgi:Uma2 family endonuclease